MTPSHLAQIQTGNANWDYFINTLLPIVGPIGVLVIGLIVLAAYILKSTSDARVRRSVEEIRQQTIVNNLAEKMPQIEADLREEQKARYIAEGRVNELSSQLKYDRDRWDKERFQFRTKLGKLGRQVKQLEQELSTQKDENSKLNEALNSALRSVNNLKAQLDESEKLRKEDKLAWEKEKYQFEETIHKLHEDIRAMKEATMPFDSTALDVTEADKEHSSHI